MIEREFIKERTKYLKAKEYIVNFVGKAAGVGRITIDKTPLGEKIIVDAVKPGLVIGRGGQTITNLTANLKEKFKLENPQIEVREILVPAKSAAVVAKRIAATLERFGPARFKAIGYRSLQNIMDAGALGAEIRITGRGVPGARSHKWRFPAGYMKKSGQIALEYIDSAVERANLRSGTVGIQVRIMHPDIPLPDKIVVKDKVEFLEPEKKEEPKPKKSPTKLEVGSKAAKKIEKKTKKAKKKTTKKKTKPVKKTEKPKEKTEPKEEKKETPTEETKE